LLLKLCASAFAKGRIRLWRDLSGLRIIHVKKHNVHFYEVVAAFDDPHGYNSIDTGEYEDRWLWIERTP